MQQTSPAANEKSTSYHLADEKIFDTPAQQQQSVKLNDSTGRELVLEKKKWAKKGKKNDVCVFKRLLRR